MDKNCDGSIGKLSEKDAEATLASRGCKLG